MVESPSTLNSVEDFLLFELVLGHLAYSSCQECKKLPGVLLENRKQDTCLRQNIPLGLEIIDELRFFHIEVTRYIAMQKIYLQYVHIYIHTVHHTFQLGRNMSKIQFNLTSCCSLSVS